MRINGGRSAVSPLCYQSASFFSLTCFDVVGGDLCDMVQLKGSQRRRLSEISENKYSANIFDMYI